MEEYFDIMKFSERFHYRKFGIVESLVYPNMKIDEDGSIAPDSFKYFSFICDNMIFL